MAFLISTDLEQFLDSLEGFFAERFPSAVVHGEKPDTAKLAADWKALAELGATAAPLPDTMGGLSMGIISAFTITEKAGRWLSPLPVRESIGTISALVAAGADVALVGELAAGTAICIPPEVAAGSIWFSADLLRSENSVGLKKLEAALLFKRTIPPLLSAARLATAAELSGICSRVIEMTVEYTKTRKQFGKPLASFQAVQHKLADMLMWSEQISSLGRFAAWAGDNDRDQFESSVAAAFGYTSEFGPKLVETSIQLHGGIGFTWEYPLHLYLRRAKLLSTLFEGGDAGYLSLAN